MKICLIGGIYRKGGARSNYLKITPETTLETGFKDAGYDVTTLSHYDEADFSKFDIVHVHHLSYGALRMAADPSRTPFVFTPHATSHMAAGSLSRTRRVTMKYVLEKADVVVSLSNMEAEGAREAYNFDGAVLTAIPNGIDVEKYNYRRANQAGQGAPWRLLFSAQLIPIKRCDVLLRAIATLKYDVEMTLVYQNNLERELMSLAESLGLGKKMHFHARWTARTRRVPDQRFAGPAKRNRGIALGDHRRDVVRIAVRGQRRGRGAGTSERIWRGAGAPVAGRYCRRDWQLYTILIGRWVDERICAQDILD
jgi:glycosyltransferase involved in cell wall biosynthesis